MKTIEIKVKSRKETGKKDAKRLRKDDMVPCVVYGGKENILVYAHENDFRHIVYTPDVFLITLDVEGDKHMVVMQDIQFHPVTDKLIHIDFVEAFEDKPVVVSLPIKLTGSAEGIIAGGKLRQVKRYLKVKGLIKDLPEILNIDITNLNIGDSIKVADLNFDNIDILDPKQSMVMGIVTSRVVAKGMEETIEGEEGAEGEATADAEAQPAEKEAEA